MLKIKQIGKAIISGAKGLFYTSLAFSLPAMAALENLKVAGEEASVEDGDLLVMVTQKIILPVVGVISVIVCVIALLATLYHVVQSGIEYVNDQQKGDLKQTMGKPVILGVFVISISFGIAMYLKDNIASWF